MSDLRQAYVQKVFRPISIGFVGLVVVIIGGVLYLGLSSTTITVTPLLLPATANFEITIGPTTANDLELIGTVTTAPHTATVTVTPTTTETAVPAHATGTVTIVNHTNRDQPLAVSTRLRSANNIIVRTTARVDVPANGSVEAQVVADPLGADGNLPAGKFIIVALQPATQELIYGESKTSFTGGLTTGGKTLSLDELTAASNEAEQQIITEFGLSSAGRFKSLQPTSVVTDPKPEVPSPTYQVTVNAKTFEVTYNAADLDRLVRQQLSAGLSTDMELTTIESPIIELGDQPTSQSIKLQITAKGQAKLTTASPQLSSSALVNMTAGDIQTKLLGTKLIKSATVKILPWWRSTTPDQPNQIKIRLAPAEASSSTN